VSEGLKVAGGVLDSVLDAVGNTPLLRLHLPGLPPRCELWGKCEWMNPGGSVKDRTALSLVSEGEASGALTRDKTIIDSSSGNTAVGLALVGGAKGYAVELVMPETVSPERRKLCEAYRARITLTDAFRGSDGAMERVREIVALEPERYFYADQYRNRANPLAHYRTTGPEIFEQTSGRLTHFVAGLGTTGTLVGTSRYLRSRSARARVRGSDSGSLPSSPPRGRPPARSAPRPVWPRSAPHRTTEPGARSRPRSAGRSACRRAIAASAWASPNSRWRIYRPGQ
jgi:cysteine synthase